jgi:aromatic ring-cleaving dioxygenase
MAQAAKISKKPVNRHDAYHAHIYFDRESAEGARRLTENVAELFGLNVGRFHEKLVGPHPHWSCQVEFFRSDFDAFVSWLDQNRNGLTVLVHGVTGNDLKDHTEYAYWLGQGVELNLEMFKP